MYAQKFFIGARNMSIYDMVQFVSQHPFDTFLFGGVSGLLLIFVCGGIYESKKIKQNKKTEIEKARKYYGDLTKGAIYLEMTEDKNYHGYFLDRFTINGEEFKESLSFGKFDKRPKENEQWRVELNGTDLKFVEKIGTQIVIKNPQFRNDGVITASNIRYYNNGLELPKEANNPNNITKISINGIKPLEDLEKLMKESEPSAKTPPMLPAGQESIIKKESEPSANIGPNVELEPLGEPIESPPDPKIYDIDTCKPDKKGFYWVKSENKWYAAWFSDAKDFYVANLGSDVPFKDKYGNRTISHWAPIHLPSFVKV